MLLSVIITVSCGNGKFTKSGKLPSVTAHMLASQFTEVVVVLKYLDVVIKLILRLLPRLPNLVPDHGEETPWALISWKLISVSAEILVAVIIILVPVVADFIVNLLVVYGIVMV